MAVAVGYRFEIAGRWSEPDETLTDREQAFFSRKSLYPVINTVFKDRSGGDCGRFVVRFQSSNDLTSLWPLYLVDNSDIEALLRMVSLCAGQAPITP